MTTLFSPVGTADPITQLGDGPMLHIVRHYRPDKVVLFLSPEMQGHVQDDKENATAADVREYGRYEAAIRRLCASEGRPVPEIVAKNSPDNEVHLFDYFIDKFESELQELCEESNNEAVLVNVSSGTPGYQSALVALGSFGRLPIKLLQVATPNKAANSPHDREEPHGYDFETLWEINEDELQSRPSRIKVVNTPNFTDRVLRENVLKLITSFDYPAAYELACQMSEIDEITKRMIKAASNRMNLDRALSKVFKPFPNIVYLSNDPLGEYLSVMEVRLRQGNWADFVRLITPAFAQLAKNALSDSGLPEEAYLKTKTSNELDCAKIAADRRLSRVFHVSSMDSSKTYIISSNQLANLVGDYCSNGDTKRRLLDLRRFEKNCRNTLAHELHASDKRTLEKLGGLTLEEVLQHLFDLHGNMRPHLYDDINQVIIERL